MDKNKFGALRCAFVACIAVGAMCAAAPFSLGQSYAGIVENADGITVGKTANKKISFYGAGHAKQPASTRTDRQALQDVGLLATGNSDQGAVTQATNVNTAVTLNAASGTITTASASTAAVTAEAGFTFTNSAIANTSSVVIAQVQEYSGTLFTNGVPWCYVTGISAGSCTIKIVNLHATNALSGTVKIRFIVK